VQDETENMDLPATTYVGEFRGGVRHGKGKYVQPVKLVIRQALEGKVNRVQREKKKKEKEK